MQASNYSIENEKAPNRKPAAEQEFCDGFFLHNIGRLWRHANTELFGSQFFHTNGKTRRCTI